MQVFLAVALSSKTFKMMLDIACYIYRTLVESACKQQLLC